MGEEAGYDLARALYSAQDIVFPDSRRMSTGVFLHDLRGVLVDKLRVGEITDSRFTKLAVELIEVDTSLRYAALASILYEHVKPGEGGNLPFLDMGFGNTDSPHSPESILGHAQHLRDSLVALSDPRYIGMLCEKSSLSKSGGADNASKLKANIQTTINAIERIFDLEKHINQEGRRRP